MAELLQRYFRLKERGTNIKRECTGGLVSFFAMLYIVVVNPAMFGMAGMPFDGVYFATVASVMIGCLFMGIVANYPIVLGPGLGINAVLVNTIILQMGYSWQCALAACFVSASIFLILSLTSLREALIKSIPECLKIGITSGIGLFIAFLGMKNGHLIVAAPGNLLSMGSMTDPIAALTLAGVLIALCLNCRGTRGGLLLTMGMLVLLSMAMGMLIVPERIFGMPQGIDATVGELDFSQLPEMVSIVFTILLLTIFDTAGTMIGVAKQANLIKDGNFPNLRTALMADAFASFWGAILGTGPCSSYSESAAGVMAGARSGLSSVVTALCFVLVLFLMPVAQCLAQVPAITAPILVVAGISMFSEIRHLAWDDKRLMPCGVLSCLMMPYTQSITNGVAIGMFSYIFLSLAMGRSKEIHPLLYFFSLWFLLEFLGLL